MCDESQQRIAFDTDRCASAAVHAHAKQELSEKLNASILLELQHVPSFRASPSSSHKMWRFTSHYYGDTPAKRSTPDPKSVLRWGQPLAGDISTTVHQEIHGSSVGMATRIYASVRSSTGLAPRRGTDCVLCTTRGGRALAALGQIGIRIFQVLLREADAAVVRRSPAKHFSTI
jgi:hypothetical protein